MSVILSALSESRLYASAKDRIEYKSVYLMALARIKRDNAILRATQLAMGEAANQEIAADQPNAE